MKKKHIVYTLSTIPLTIALGNVNDSNAFFGLDSFISRNRIVSDVVDIKDENLLKAINNQLGRGEVLDNVTITDMENLTELDAQKRNISSIEGLEYATNLYYLHIGHNKGIVDLNPIKNLTNLVSLHIHDTSVSDVSMLSNLTKLSTLTMHWNSNIKDISVIDSLKDLKNLELGGYQDLDLSNLFKKTDLKSLKILDVSIEDLTPFTNFNKLTTLKLEGNNILDISILKNLTNLTSLHLIKNNISDVSELGSLTNLRELYLHDNQISDISFIKNLVNLNNLHLGNNRISDISSIENLTNLNRLQLYNNQISDISSIENLTSLTNLQLYNNQISDISSIENLTSLTYLQLYNNQISDISSLDNLINLKTLHLYNNQISDISSIENLINLNNLYLYGNHIKDISPLSNLINLKDLRLNNNQISDISSLSSLTGLNNLYLYNNFIEDIFPLKNLTNLNNLHLSNNKISDVSVLKKLTKLTKLELHNNQISDILPIRNVKNLTKLTLSNQKPIIEAGDFKSDTNMLDISINNPIVGLNNKISKITNISNNGIYENGKLKWNNLPLGNNTRTFNFSENITIGSATATFNGTAILNFNVVDGGAPETDHTSEFDNNDFGIYTTVTANDLGVGVDYLMHKGIRQSLPYRFKYDIYDSSSNIVEVYDLVGNKAEYQVKLKDSDIPTIEEGLDALVNKSDSGKEDISYFRKIINDLDESMNKDLLQDKLNNIYPKTLTLDRELATSNIDVYIKSENILQMALDTNSITFEDFSGVEDVIKENIVNVTINSSLPYSLNAYLPAEIQNADKTNIMDKSILNIKENSESIYQVFPNTTDKIILKDNCSAGNDLVHGVDIKLSGGISHEKDVYKTTIKFEAEQK